MSSNSKIVIASNAVTAKILKPTDEVKLLVNSYLTYFVDGYEQNSMYQTHKWDGTASMFNYAKATFPNGLKFFVAQRLKNDGFDISFYNKPLPEPLGKMRPKIGNYEEDARYEYQYTVTERLLKYGQMIFQGATGSGKTRVSEIAYATIKRPTLFLTSRQILMYQMKERIENDLGIVVSVIGDGNFGVEDKAGRHYLKQFTVATVQSIWSNLKNKKTREKMRAILERFEFIILEEAHESSADGWFEILKLCKNAYYRLALTATPFMKTSEEANMRLSASSGPIGMRVTEKQLIDCGILAKPFFKFVHLKQRPRCLANGTPWQPAYRLGIVENEERNQAIVNEARRAVDNGLTVMVLFKQIAHGRKLKALFDTYGVANELIVGENDQEERKQAINKLKNGEIKVLLGSTILDVGVDVPAVGMIILASGGKAEVATRQRIGRGLRAKKNAPNVCFIVDFDDPFNKYTKRHAMQRFNIIKSTDGFKDNIVLDFDYKWLNEEQKKFKEK